MPDFLSIAGTGYLVLTTGAQIKAPEVMGGARSHLRRYARRRCPCRKTQLEHDPVPDATGALRDAARRRGRGRDHRLQRRGARRRERRLQGQYRQRAVRGRRIPRASGDENRGARALSPRSRGPPAERGLQATEERRDKVREELRHGAPVGKHAKTARHAPGGAQQAVGQDSNALPGTRHDQDYRISTPRTRRRPASHARNVKGTSGTALHGLLDDAPGAR